MITSATIHVNPIATSGRAFRITDGHFVFDVRTSSRRRYLVVNLDTHRIDVRTDHGDLAEHRARRSGARCFVLDAHDVIASAV
jgi:hypothetical protein